MPAPETRPTVGFNPTMPLMEDGQTIDPFVSVPIASGARCAAIAAPEPELEPQAVRALFAGFTARPPTALQPLDEVSERKLAHSERFAFARITRPEASRRSTSGALLSRRLFARASEPAVVTMPAKSMLSLMITGTPCSGPRVFPAARS